MPEITRQIGTVSESLVIRFIQESTDQPENGVTVAWPNLQLWYWRDGESQVFITPVALASLDAPYAAGGLHLIDDGYYRLDVPDEVFEDGATLVQIGGSGDDLTTEGVSIQLLAATSPYVPAGVDSPAQLLPCDLLMQEAPSQTRDGCPIRTGRRHVPMRAGVCGDVLWTMRTTDGRVANLTTCLTDSLSGTLISMSESLSVLDEGHSVKVRFQGCDQGCSLAEVDATVVDAEHGLIRFTVPEAICQIPGIYSFQAAVVDNGRPLFIDSGLLSVEPSLWDAGNGNNPPTIEELRMHLRDYPEANSLLGEVEFTDQEILYAVAWPVRQFNETPPPLAHFSCNNFPYKFHWRNAIVAQLLQTASHSYLRNKLQTSSGGLSVDDKNKNAEYLQLAMLYEREWKEFILREKASLNARLFMGSVGRW